MTMAKKSSCYSAFERRLRPKEKEITDLILAAEWVWDAFLIYGPVDDGRTEGQGFADALTFLMKQTRRVRASREKDSSK
jgi:hypothetical protein